MSVPTFVLASDSKFAMQLAVAVHSVAGHHTETGSHIYLLHDQIDRELHDRVTCTLPASAEVEWIEVNSHVVDAAHRPDFLPPASLFRLLMPSLVPREVERVIYLDADTTVCSPLTELWETPLADDLCAAVSDPLVPWVGAPLGLPWRDLGIPPTCPYMNAGVLVVPLDRWRDEDIAAKTLALMAQHQFHWADQCALNAVVRGRWRRVSPSWNLQSGHLISKTLGWVVEPAEDLDAALRDPSLVHYTNAMSRPWQWRSSHPYRARWEQWLSQTDWVGWRPTIDYERAYAWSKGRIRARLRKAAMSSHR